MYQSKGGLTAVVGGAGVTTLAQTGLSAVVVACGIAGALLLICGLALVRHHYVGAEVMARPRRHTKGRHLAPRTGTPA